MSYFSWRRCFSIIIKEFYELRRDYVSLIFIMLVPLIQLIIYGYSINTDPKQLPTMLINADNGALSRSFIQGLENTDYFRIVELGKTEQEAQQALSQGRVRFVISIPADFTKNILRGEVPKVLVQVDAVNPTAIANAIGALQVNPHSILGQDLPISLRGDTPAKLVSMDIHKMYNPEAISQYTFVPGLNGTLLNSILVLLTSMAIIREKESGAMENLLVSPLTSLEFILGKLSLYAVIGFIEAMIILIPSVFVFDIPIFGSLPALLSIIMVFIVLSLAIGLVISSFAKDKLQAMHFSFCYFLPSIMLSGFVSPFAGMPEWAKQIGNLFPLTHFLRLIKGIMVKGSSLADLQTDFIYLIVITVVVIIAAVALRRNTLD